MDKRCRTGRRKQDHASPRIILRPISCPKSSVSYLEEIAVQCYHDKSSRIFSKEPCILLKEPYTMAQEPYILSKEPYFIPRTVMRQYHDKRSLEILKRALWNDKKAVYLPKTTQYHDKHTPSRLARALYNGKKAPYPPSQKSPISCIRAVYHTLNKLRCAKTIEVETWRALLSAYNIISKEPCIMAKEPHIL